MIEYRAAHFSITCLADSPAEAGIEAVAGRLEAVWTAVAERLGSAVAADEPIEVHLAELLDTDYTLADGRIVLLYRSDAPATRLEHAVAELLLSRFASAPQPAPFLIAGLLGAATTRTADADTALRDHQRHGGLLSLANAILGSESGVVGHRIAVSFVAYVLERFGPSRFAELARALDPAAPDEACAAALGAPLASVEAQWLASLSGAEHKVIGVGGFLRWSARYLRPYWPRALLIGVLLIVVASFNVVLPLSLRFLIDFAILPGDYALLVLILAGLVALFVAQAAAEMTAGYLSTVVGTQAERVALARALVRDPALLLLDEATSALDPEAEAAINATLARLRVGRTVVAVTHRLASVVGCDLIVVLEHGRVVQQGTHDELLAQAGAYRRLWEQQHVALVQPGDVATDSLRSVPYFGRLDGVLLAAVASHFATERFTAGEVIFRAGEPGDRFYVIVRGQVDVLATDEAGQERRLSALSDGDYFGEIALLRDVPRTATARGRTPTARSSWRLRRLCWRRR